MEKEKEVWRDVPNYKNYYQVSNLGRVRSLDRTIINSLGIKRFYKGRFFEGSDVDGYKMVTLSRDGKQEKFLIHQLIAMTFLNHTPNGHILVVDHINGVKADNRVENLRIVTNRENVSTCYRANEDLLSSKFVGVHYHKPTNKFQVRIQLNSKRIYLGQFDSEEDASDVYQKALAKINDGTFNPDDYKPKFTSNFKGVSFDKSRQKWFAKYTHNGKQKYLGSFKTEQEAYQKLLEFEACTLAV